MALDFPNSPTNGSTYTSGIGSWIWDGIKWNAANTQQFVPIAGGTMTGILNINYNTQAIVDPYPGVTTIHTKGIDGSNNIILQDAYGAPSQPQFVPRSGRGTAAAPAALQAGDYLGVTNYFGHDGSAFGFGGNCGMLAVDNFTTGAHGTEFRVYTIATGTTGGTNRISVRQGLMILDGSGNTPVGGDPGPGSINAAGNISCRSSNMGIYGSSGSWPAFIMVKAAAGVANQIVGSVATTGNYRWVVSVGDQTGESGSNAGSDFDIGRYSDTGAWLGNPFFISRATGQVTLTGNSPQLLLNGGANDSHIHLYHNNRTWAVCCQYTAISANGFLIYDGTAGLGRLLIDVNGTCYNTQGTWNVISDTRLKTDVTPYGAGLNEVLALEPIKFRYTGAANTDPNQELIGFAAEAVEKVMPELVSRMRTRINEDDAEDSEILTLAPTGVVFALVNAVKELTARLEALEGAR